MGIEKIKSGLIRVLKNKYFPFICGAVLLFVWFTAPKKSGDTILSESYPDKAAFSADEFESELSDILSDIRGVRNAKVLLTYDGGTKYIYAEDVSETESEGRRTSSKDTVVAGGEAVIVGSLNPKVSGAVVVYSGTRSASVTLDLTNAVQAATGLSTDKITVLWGG